MKLVAWIFGFSLLDEQIAKMRALRDAFRQANGEHCRVYLAEIPENLAALS